MKANNKWVVACAALIALPTIAYVGIGSYTQKRAHGIPDSATQAAAARNLAANPVEQWRDELDRDALEKSLACVDSKGMMTCGKYAGQQALVHAALIGSQARISELSTREILIDQGDRAVAAAAALGDLEAVKLLVAQGAANGLLDQNQLQRYPLFAGSDDKGAHPAGSAAEFGQVSVLSFFVEHGFDVDTKLSADGVTDVFLQALLRQKIDVIRYLFNHGYRIDCAFRFKNGRTYEAMAERLGFHDGASLIKEKCPKS